MPDLEQKVRKNLVRIFGRLSGMKFTVALSGGRDSVCLLSAMRSILSKEEVSLSAIHVHHGMRETASRDEAFCRDLCEKWDIPYQAVFVDVPALIEEEGLSPEDAARRLRYRALSENDQGSVVLLAHHRQDQAETVMLHLLRGTSLRGLAGMKEITENEFGGGTICRPMLDVSEEELEAYVREHQITCQLDETNFDLHLTRNRVRRELWPVLQEYNPKITDSLAGMAASLGEDLDYLEKEAERAYLLCLADTGLKIPVLQSFHKALQSRILLRFLEDNGLSKDISRVHLNHLYSLLGGPSGRQIVLPKGLTLEKSYDILCIYSSVYPAPIDLSKASVKRLSREESDRVLSDLPSAIFPEDSRRKILVFPEGKPLPVWRRRQSGDYMMIRCPDGSWGKKKLQDILQDEKVPRDRRDHLVLLCDGQRVLWIVGGRISEDAKIGPENHAMIDVYYEGE